MNPRINQLIQILKMRNGGDPQQLIFELLGNEAQNNPMLANLLDMAKQGKGADIESVAKNMLKSQGFDFDKEFNDFKQAFGFK